MNILIPHKWLLEYLDTKATPKQIQKYLSLCGPSVETVTKHKNDYIYDIEVTTNRVDCMSVSGFARECAAILPQFNIKAKLKKIKLKLPTSTKPLDIKIIPNHKLGSTAGSRILGIKLENITIKPSPKWLQTRLLQIGQRPLNNAIDITNYAMWELGHPIHVFDYDRLQNKTINVRLARKGETLVTLDNQKITLKGGEVVFDNKAGQIILLPGIMGTKNTVVTPKTRNCLLWIESIDAKRVRYASMTHDLRSQAAVLNEKQVDPELALPTFQKAVSLFTKLANAKVASRIHDIYPKPPKAKPINLKQSQLDTYMGLKLKPSKVKTILSNLNCQTSFKNKTYKVTPPSYRIQDMQIPQDVIEEIARIFGYHNLPGKLMDTPIPSTSFKQDYNLLYQIKTWLAGWGLNELYTYSFVSKELAIQSGFDLKNHVKLKNPLLDDWVYMRRSLIPSLIEALNQNSTQPKLDLFELQNIYQPATSKTNLPNQKLSLNVITNQNYKHLKGILDNLLIKLHLPQTQVVPTQKPPSIFNPSKTGIIKSNSKTLGFIGQIKNTNLFAIDIKIPELISLANTYPAVTAAINHPPIIEDLTFHLPSKTHISFVIDEIINSSHLIEKVILKTIYKQNATFTIYYRHRLKTLTDKQIAPIRKKVITNLKKSFKTKLIGKL